MKKPLPIFLIGCVVGFLSAVGTYCALVYSAGSRESEYLVRAQSESTMKAHAHALHAYFMDSGHWPEVLAEIAPGNDGIMYISLPSGQFGRDAWGHPIVYRPATSSQAFSTLISYGADGAPGGTGNNADIEFRLTEHGISRPWNMR